MAPTSEKIIMSTFRYHADILARYPNIIGGVILLQGITNGSTPEHLRISYQAEQEAVKERIGNTPLSQIQSLEAWRGAFRRFGVDPTQYRSAAEALLRRLTKKGDIPSINLLVDIGNMISIRYALPVAVIDAQAVQGAITVHFADGSERSSMLGKNEIDHPESGEVIFSDEEGQIIARRWCWRQGEESAAQTNTTEAIIAIEAHHANGRRDVAAALTDLQELLHKYAGGTLQTYVLDAGHATTS
jgi:DNA/RNA-binding domain of Phe-tRNA-synthetase-like protein